MSLDCVNSGGVTSQVNVDAPLQLEQVVELAPRAAAALPCWQLRTGEALTVVDSLAVAWRARLVADGPYRVVPFEKFDRPVESPVRIAVYQALPEKERFELILQKLTELGVYRIVPVETLRSTTCAQRDAVQRKSHRWPEVVRRAAKQCRRAMLPELTPVAGWQQALDDAAGCEVRLLLYEQQTGWSLNEALGRQRPASVALFVGPEGGFSAEEVAAARGRGVLPVSLGPRILRTETAAIAALTAVQYAVGDLATGNG